MREKGPTFWLLDSQYFAGEKNTLSRQGVSAGSAGIKLQADPAPESPLALASPDGSLGGLVLPKGMALDREGTIYLLGRSSPWIKRFDPISKTFVLLPATGGYGAELRKFDTPSNIAIAGNNLYVADLGNRRIQVFDLRTLVLRYVWGPWDANDAPVEAADPDVWEPVDVASHAQGAYVLDKRHARVYHHRIGENRLRLVFEDQGAIDRWTRIIADRQGQVYLLNASVPQLAKYSGSGLFQKTIVDAGDIRDDFDHPAVRLDHKGRFCLPASLARLCSRQVPQPPPPSESPMALCPPVQKPGSGESGLVFDLEGNPARIDPGEPAGPTLYRKSGTWISAALDSKIYRCQWHRIVLADLGLPSGTSVVVSTYASQDEKTKDDVLALPEQQWDTRFRITGAMQGPGSAVGSTSPQEFLVLSKEGQFLWLRIQLFSDGYATPRAGNIRVYYPRESHLKFLPAVYGADDDGRRFMERFLSIFQTEWDDLSRRVREIARYFDPAAVPAGPFMDYLASWLAVPLEATWTEEQKRNLLRAMPKLLKRIGTRRGVHGYLRAYLQSMTDSLSEHHPQFPQILEGFRERKWLALRTPGMAGLGGGAPVWSRSVVSRLQLGVFSREGEARLVSTGHPEKDPFEVFAHRFRIFVPSCWIRSTADEQMFRRAVDAVKPAHTAYELCLVDPRFRVGVQSTIGIDTIVGQAPAAQLGCESTKDAPGLLPGHRLGHDTVLNAGTDAATMKLLPGASIGLETQLA
jgi:phage tail-like protein